jgi:hypothetical protein
MITMNIVSGTIKFNNTTNSDIAHRYPTTFSPAPYTYTIWALIFASLGVYTIYQTFPKFQSVGGLVSRIGLVVSINFIANGLWLVAFAYEVMALSVVIILVILGTLIFIHVAAGIGEDVGIYPVSKHIRGGCCPYFEEQELDQIETTELFEEPRTMAWYATTFWCIDFPFSLYFAWILVISVANIAVLAEYYGAHVIQDAAIWSLLMQSLIAFVTIIMLVTCLDIVFGCVVVWTLLGIHFHQKIENVSKGALGLAIIVAILTFIAFGYRMFKLYSWNRRYGKKGDLQSQGPDE